MRLIYVVIIVSAVIAFSIVLWDSPIDDSQSLPPGGLVDAPLGSTRPTADTQQRSVPSPEAPVSRSFLLGGVTGLVTVEGRPLPGARVCVAELWEDERFGTTTDENGAYQLTLPPDVWATLPKPYAVVAATEAHVGHVMLAASPSPGDASQAPIEAVECGVVTGLVDVGEVHGGWVRFTPESTPSGCCSLVDLRSRELRDLFDASRPRPIDEDGRFAIGPLPECVGTLRITVADRVFREISGIAISCGKLLDLGEVSPLELERLSGRVRNADDALVQVLDETASVVAEGRGGRFAVPVPAGTYDVLVRKPGVLHQRQDDVRVPGPELDIILQPGGVVEVATGSSPLGPLDVSIHARDDRVNPLIEQDDGVVRVEGVVGGFNVVLARADGVRIALWVDGLAPGEVRSLDAGALSENLSVAGEITTSVGRPAEGAVVTLTGVAPPIIEGWQFSSAADESGRFEMTGLAGGAWSAQVAMRGMADLVQRVDLPQPELSFCLDQACEIAIEVPELTELAAALGGSAPPIHVGMLRERLRSTCPADQSEASWSTNFAIGVDGASQVVSPGDYRLACFFDAGDAERFAASGEGAAGEPAKVTSSSPTRVELELPAHVVRTGRVFIDGTLADASAGVAFFVEREDAVPALREAHVDRGTYRAWGEWSAPERWEFVVISPELVMPVRMGWWHADAPGHYTEDLRVRPAGRLEVETVESRSGEPIAGLPVRVQWVDGDPRLDQVARRVPRTDERGKLSLIVGEPGIYRLSTERGGLPTPLQRVDVVEGETHEITLAVAPGARVSGYVVPPDELVDRMEAGHLIVEVFSPEGNGLINHQAAAADGAFDLLCRNGGAFIVRVFDQITGDRPIEEDVDLAEDEHLVLTLAW